MRSIKELLQVMLDNQQEFYSGMCYWVNHLYSIDVITSEERAQLHIYINKNRPSKWSSFGAFVHRDNGYYWTRGDIKPRIKWIKKHIKLNS